MASETCVQDEQTTTAESTVNYWNHIFLKWVSHEGATQHLNQYRLEFHKAMSWDHFFIYFMPQIFPYQKILYTFADDAVIG